MIIAIDFDDTIAFTDYPEIIEEVPGAIKTINDLYSDHDLILSTCREGKDLDAAECWLLDKDILRYFDYINSNTKKHIEKWKTDPRKIGADLFIDDRAIGWQGWHQVRKYFCLDIRY